MSEPVSVVTVTNNGVTNNGVTNDGATPDGATNEAAAEGQLTDAAGIQARYGRTPTRKKRDRRILWLGAALFVVVFGAWVIWAGTDSPDTQIDARDIGYTIIDDSSISVTFEVSVPEGTRTSCVVQALNESFTVVGWKVVDLPASDRFTRSFTEVLNTSELSNTGLIYRCWLS